MTATNMTVSTSVPPTEIPAGQPRFQSLVRMELRKLRYRPMTFVIFGIMAALLSGLMTIGYIATRVSNRPPGVSLEDDVRSFLFPGVFQDGFSIIGGVGGILLVVIAAAIIGSEYSWGTIRVLVGSGVPRARLIASKLVTVGLVTIGLTIVGFLAFTITSVGIAIFGGHTLDMSWLNGGTAIDLLLMFVRTIFILFVSAVLAFTVTVFSRSLAAGIAVGIGYMVFEGIAVGLLGLMGNVGETLADLLLSPNMNAIQQPSRTTSASAPLPATVCPIPGARLRCSRSIPPP
ncbi:MAG: ABC transporter permease [Thermomicrobiales bacterium]|nr:ABC transporter permease [Thermomicrobiales bacterium]